jgi:hypothetical protein
MMIMKLVRFLALVLCVMLLTACGGGDVSEVGRQVGEPMLFSEQEVDQAMDEVVKFFRAEFDGCKLLNLRYDEEWNREAAEGWARQYDAEEAIVLLSDFKVNSSGGDGSLNPDSTYRNWKWILIRVGNGWELKTWGYG